MTTETRALKPLPRRPPHPSAVAEKGAKTGPAGGDGRASRPAASSSGASSSTDLGGFQEEHAVDAWRFLLNLDPESFEAGVDVVPAGKPLVPEFSSSMITESMAGYSQQDRVMMTLGFIRFLRLLMAEVTLAFERGVAAGRARDHQEVLVDVVPEEEGDGTDLMQRTLSGYIDGGSGSGEWLRHLQALQVELAKQPAPLRNANIGSLKARLERAPRVTLEQRTELQAVLVAMEDEDCGAAVGDVGWSLRWWNQLFPVVGSGAACSSDAVIISEVPVLRDEDIAMLASGQQEVRREKALEEDRRRQQEAQRENDEVEQESYLQWLHQDRASCDRDARTRPELSARELKEWEDWEWAQLLDEPPQKRKRSSVLLTVGGGHKDGGPWVSKTLRVPCPRDGGMPTFQVAFTWEEDCFPDDVETVRAPSPRRGVDPVVAGAEPADVGVEDCGTGVTGPCAAPPVAVTEVQEDTAVDVEGTMQDLSFTDYEDLYKKWKAGTLTGCQVKGIGGANLLDIMEAQWILDTETPVGDTMQGIQPKFEDKFEEGEGSELSGEIYKDE